MNTSNEKLAYLAEFVKARDGCVSKEDLQEAVKIEFLLSQDRKVFYCEEFAIRFSHAKGKSFGNTVLSLSAVQKYDSRPLIICIVREDENELLIANTTFLKKISHSSHELRVDNIKGSFNGSDICREFNGLPNNSANLWELYLIHDSIGFEGNLERLVEATQNIQGVGTSFELSSANESIIRLAPKRAIEFCGSSDYQSLKTELDSQVHKHANAILAASMIDNVKIRGSLIEYIVAGGDEKVKNDLIGALMEKRTSLPRFSSDNALGDYTRIFPKYCTQTDVKTKIMFLDSNPKAYNIDKMLEFLSTPKSVYMLYLVGIDIGSIFNTQLVSMFTEEVALSTILLRHWAGRNSRGVTQFEGKSLKRVLAENKTQINIDAANLLVERLINS